MAQCYKCKTTALENIMSFQWGKPKEIPAGDNPMTQKLENSFDMCMPCLVEVIKLGVRAS